MSRNKDLAAILSEKHGLSKMEADKFVVTMFGLINDALSKDKLVKVKGLGTFKVVSVASRKSVDVNTGAPIVIEGRDKITFTPDTSLRDEVNKPFAQFDTVVVNDGVDFSVIDKKYNGEEEIVESDYEIKHNESLPISQKQQPHEVLDDEKTLEEKVENPPQEELYKVDSTPSEPTGFAIHRALKVTLIAVAVLLTLCIAGAYYMFTQLQKRDNRIANLEAQVSVTKKKSVDKMPSKPNTTSNKLQTKKIVTVDASNQTKENAVEDKSSEKEIDTKFKTTSSYSYNGDPRVRTGAYNIVGIDKTITVKPGQTLTSISRFYFGPGMECYIEAVNGGRTEFKAGEKIKIPKLKHKKSK